MEPFIDVLHEDEHLVVLNKQSGLLSVPGKAPEHKDCLETRVQDRYPSALQVHRLDRGTSGVFIMALTSEAQNFLQRGFERRLTEKHYVAEVFGVIKEDEGTVDLPLMTDWPNRPMQKVDHENGRAALTHWNVIERGRQTTRVALRPVTGRSHQLRVHLLELGYPIVGDDFYAPDEVLALSDRLHLHAESLTLPHPKDKERVTFSTPCPF
jgi:tRNA pseudouridine32 synthase/23S rRNA pseudouridine746 synthase